VGINWCLNLAAVEVVVVQWAKKLCHFTLFYYESL